MGFFASWRLGVLALLVIHIVRPRTRRTQRRQGAKRGENLTQRRQGAKSQGFSGFLCGLASLRLGVECFSCVPPHDVFGVRDAQLTGDELGQEGIADGGEGTGF